MSLFAGGLFFLTSAWAQEKTVYIRNQQLEMDSQNQAVSVIHFVRLLEEAERGRVQVLAQEIVVTDREGVPHSLTLDSTRKLSEWRRALELLGYVRRFNEETGIVDYRVASAADGTANSEPILESNEIREGRSLRRPGYLKAQKNYQKVIEQIGLSDNASARARVDRLGQMIALKSPLAGIKWNFDVIRSDTPNALCTGEGHVLVTTGLLDLKLSDDELAGVLGHEVAHGVRRHAEIYEERFTEYLAIRSDYLDLQRQYQMEEEYRNTAKVKELVARLEKKKNRLEFLVSYLTNKKDYDQDEEEESDVLGMQYAVAAGFDPEGETRALIKLKAKSVQLFGQSYDSGSRTHPPLDRRLQILETVRRRWRDERRP